MTQLNTSPWPTTGSSPVQSATHLVWPPSVRNNSKGNGDIFSTQPGFSENQLSGTSTSQTNSNFADFGNVNTISSANLSTSKPTSGPFPDPFGAAPNSNFQQQSGRNTIGSVTTETSLHCKGHIFFHSAYSIVQLS